MAYIGNSPGTASQRIVSSFTATSGQTEFTLSSGYTLGYLDVYLNGVKLINGVDYTASNGTTFALTSAAALDDSLEAVAYIPRGLSDGYTKAEADALLATKEASLGYTPVNKAGDTMTGNLEINASLDVSGSVILGNVSNSSNIAQLTGGTPVAVVTGYSSPTTSYVPHSSTELVVARDGDVGIGLIAASTGNAVIRFGDAEVESSGMIDYDHADDSMAFRTNAVERLIIDSAGRVTMPYQPMFCYYNSASSSQYPTASTWGTLNTLLNNWNATRWYSLLSSTDFNNTNGKFTAPVAGKYLFTANVSFWVTSTLYIDFWINGAITSPYIIMYDAGNYQTGTLTMIKQLGAGDTVELGGYFSSSTTYVPGAGYLIFSGHLIG